MFRFQLHWPVYTFPLMHLVHGTVFTTSIFLGPVFLRYVTPFEKAYFYKNDFFSFLDFQNTPKFKNAVEKELCFYPFWLKSYSEISNSW